MAKARNLSENGGFADQFKPAIQLGRPDTDQWATNFFLTEQKESYDGDGYPRVHYNPDAQDPPLNSIYSLITQQPGFRPNFRSVDVVGKRDYQAICMESAVNEPGIYVTLFKIVDSGNGGFEAHVNLRVMPVSKLADLVVGPNAKGELQIALPTTDIYKLNLTLRASSTGEPLFRTHKTEVRTDNAPEFSRKELENSLNTKAGSVIAFIAAQILEMQGQWPPVAQVTAEFPTFPWPPADGKKVLASIVVTAGAFVVTGAQFYNQNYVVGSGAAIGAIGSLYNIFDAWVGRRPVEGRDEEAPPIPPPNVETTLLLAD